MCVTLAGREYRMEVSRKELILQAEPLFERMAQPIRRVLSDGQKSAGEVDAVVLVGGSCKMPVVQKYLNYLLQRTDIAVVSPDYMIALGAGVRIFAICFLRISVRFLSACPNTTKQIRTVISVMC